MPVIGLTRHASEAELQAEADEVWQRDWVVECTRNGDIDLELIKTRLCGYSHLMEIVSIVYDELSGGQISKPGYNDTSQIIGTIRDAMEESCNEDVIDVLKSSLPEGALAIEVLRPYITDVCTGLEIDPVRVFE